MKLKNLNPLAGISQITRGYFSIPRVLIMELILEKQVNPTLLGYAMICINVADWDKSPLRFGYIRHDIDELADALQIGKSTLYENLKKLERIGFLSYEEKIYKVVNFESYTLRGAQKIAKATPTPEKFISLFPFLKNDSEKLESVLSRKDDSFKVSSNVFFKSSLPKDTEKKKPRIRSEHDGEGMQTIENIIKNEDNKLNPLDYEQNKK